MSMLLLGERVCSKFPLENRIEMVDDLSNGNLLKIFEDLVVIKDVLNSNERCNHFSKT